MDKRFVMIPNKDQYQGWDIIEQFQYDSGHIRDGETIGYAATFDEALRKIKEYYEKDK